MRTSTSLKEPIEVSPLSLRESILDDAGVDAENGPDLGARTSNLDDLVSSVRKLLTNIQRTIPDSELCGVGLLVCSDPDRLPMCPLNSNPTTSDTDDVVNAICNASMIGNPNHEGFHVLTPGMELTHTNQYIAPPLPPDFLSMCPSPGVGARHMSALLASRLPEVICAATLNTRNNILIFVDGTDRPHLHYLYEANPLTGYKDDNPAHIGAAILKPDLSSRDVFRGNYFTDSATSGHFVMTRRS